MSNHKALIHYNFKMKLDETDCKVQRFLIRNKNTLITNRCLELKLWIREDKINLNNCLLILIKKVYFKNVLVGHNKNTKWIRSF